jgi:hypothetical protein
MAINGPSNGTAQRETKDKGKEEEENRRKRLNKKAGKIQ